MMNKALVLSLICIIGSVTTVQPTLYSKNYWDICQATRKHYPQKTRDELCRRVMERMAQCLEANRSHTDPHDLCFEAANNMYTG